MRSFILIINFVIASYLLVAQPTVNLGNDTTLCNGSQITLNAGNAGAVFLWNTGATTQTITANSSGIYWVDVTNSGTTRDSISVQVLNSPGFTANDTSFCSGIRTLLLQNVQPSSFLYVWWNSLTAGSVVHTGTTLTQNFNTGSQSFFIDAFGYIQTLFAGYLDNSAGGTSAGFTDTRGLVFNALSTISIDSVSVYITANVSFNIELRNSANTVLQTKSYSLTGTGLKRIPVEIYVPAGTGYRLVINNRVGGSLFYRNTGATFPISNSLVSITSSIINTTINSTTYYYLYNIRVSKLSCQTSPRDAMLVTVNQNPNFYLPTDTFHCLNPVVISAAVAGGTYIWSNGQTTSSIVANSGSYAVTTSIGPCVETKSIQVTILPADQFSANDSTLCAGTRTVQLSNTNSSTHHYVWWDAPTGGNAINYGSSLTQNYIAGTYNYYVAAYNFGQNELIGYLDNSAGGTNIAANDSRGLVFNATADIYLDSLSVYINANSSFTIELRNSANTLIHSRSITLTGTGEKRIPLGFFIAAGTGYRLLIANRTSGSIFYRNSAATYPLNSLFTSITSSIVNGVVSSTTYYYFYNIRIKRMSCPSNRDSMAVTVLDYPSFYLPADTSICGSSLNLSAFYPSATYAWSNGVTTANNLINNSGLYQVTVSLGNCTALDTVNVNLLAVSNFTANDTALCSGIRNIQLSNTNQNLFSYLWYDAATGGNILNSGPSYVNNYAVGNYSYYVEAWTNGTNELIGYPDNSNGGVNQSYNDVRGIVFNANTQIMIDSVSVYTGGDVSFTIQLQNSAGAVLLSRNFSLVGTGLKRLELKFLVSAGTAYRLVLTNRVGSSLFVRTSATTFPFAGSLASLTSSISNGATSGSTYYYFYNWRIQAPRCGTARDSMTVTVNPDPIVSVPSDTIHCGSSILLDASYPAANYLWSNGQTTAVATLTQSGNYSVTVSLGSCLGTDNGLLTLVPLSGFSAPDTTICSGLRTISLLQIDTINYSYFWWDDPIAGNFINAGPSFTSNFTSGAQNYYIEAHTISGTSTAGYPDNSNGGIYFAATDVRGLVFNANSTLRIDSVSVYINANTNFTLELRNSSNTTLFSRSYTLTGNGEIRIPVGCNVAQGTGYRLVITNRSGGSLFYRNTGTSYPISSSLITFTSGIVNSTLSSSQYYYFYNLKLTRFSCKTNRDPLTVTVQPTPSFSFPTDTIHCGSSLTLSASFPNGQYLWSTGSTASSFTFNADQAYSVTTTALGCSNQFSGTLSLLSLNNYSLADQTICSGLRSIPISNTDTVNFRYLWLDNPNGNILSQGPLLTQNFSTGNYTYYTQVFRRSESGSAGFPDNSNGGVNLSANDPRGLVFNSLFDITIDSLSIYSSASVSFALELRDNLNNLIYSRSYTLIGSGLQRIPVNFLVPQGNGYRLLLSNRVGGQVFYKNNGLSFPLNYAHIQISSSIINGTVNSGTYHYFYNLFTTRMRCASIPDPVLITVTPNPVSNLPADTVACSNSIQLDVNNPSANYLWSNGSTASSITVNNNGSYATTISIGNCRISDTIQVNLVSVSNFSARDTTLCSGLNTLSLSNADPSRYLYLWWDDPIAGNIVGWGNSFTTQLNTGSVTYHVESRTKVLRELVGYFDNSSGGSYAGYNDTRGILFNALEDISIDTVLVYVNNAISFTVQLRNSANAVIYSVPFSFSSAGAYDLPLDFYVPTGTGYLLVITNRTGGALFFKSSAVSYPFTSSLISLTNGTLNGNYFYFYNWRISSLACQGTRDALIATVLQTPEINLPFDTLGCGSSLTLNLSYPGSTYLWSNGSTNSTQTFLSGNPRDTLTVELRSGICVARDTFSVLVLDTISFNTYDTTMCGGTISLPLINPSGYQGVVYWRDSSGQVIDVGDILHTELYDTTTVFAEIRPVERSISEGYPNFFTLGASFSNFYPIGGDHGNAFNVNKDIILDSVVVYVDVDSITATFMIQDANTNVLYSSAVTLYPGLNYIPIGIFLATGNGYRILLSGISGNGKVFIDVPFPFPLVYEHITINNSLTANRNYYFYDWRMRTTACPGSSKPVRINIRPTAEIGWPRDTIVCSGALTLNVTTPNSTYLWHDGSLMPTNSTTQNDTLWVEVNTGFCISRDTIYVSLSTPPSQFFPPNDTTLCGGSLILEAAGNANGYAWYTQAVGGQPFELGDSISVNVLDSTILYVEGLSFLRESTTYGHSIVPASNGTYVNIGGSFYPNRALAFDVFQNLKLDEFSIFSDSAFSARISLKDNLGIEIYSRNVNINSAGEHIISLNWLLAVGNDYTLWIENHQGGKLYVVINYNFPLNYPELRIKSGLPQVLGNQYSCFYKWKVSTPSCATNRAAVQINVPEYPTFIMPSDSAICGGNNISVQATNNNTQYQYLWSNGATTNQVNLSQAGTFRVTVTNAGICSSQEEILVQFPTAPSSILLFDTSICGPQHMQLLQNPNDGILVWYDPLNLNPLYISAPYPTYVGDTTQYVVGVGAKATARVGLSSNNNYLNNNYYQNFIIPNTFDILQPTVLDSVAVYVNGAPGSFDIILSDQSNQILYTRSFTVNQNNTKIFLPLGFVLLPGTGYQLQFSNSGNINFLIDPFTVYPISTGAQVATLTGTIFPTVSYNCFYDWHFTYALNGCYAPQNAGFQINVNLPLNLPDSIYTCTDVTLDANTSAAVSYLWSNGASTSSIQASQTGYYYVTVSDAGNCIVNDTAYVETPVALQLPNSSTICGNTISSNYDPNLVSSYVWSTGDSSSSIFVINPGTYQLTITTASGCILSDSMTVTAFESAPLVDIGNYIEICSTQVLDAGFTGMGYTYLWNTAATSQSITVSSEQIYRVTVTTGSGCYGIDSVYVRILPFPTAAFSYTISSTSLAFINNSANSTSYYWIFGDNTTATLSNPYHYYFNPGCYDVSLIARNSCFADTITQRIAVGVSSTLCQPITIVIPTTVPVEEEAWKLYPNPNSGSYQIEFNTSEENEPVIVQIIDIRGQIIWEEQYQFGKGLQQIFISDLQLPNGMYINRLIRKNGIQSKSFVLMRS